MDLVCAPIMQLSVCLGNLRMHTVFKFRVTMQVITFSSMRNKRVIFRPMLITKFNGFIFKREVKYPMTLINPKITITIGYNSNASQINMLIKPHMYITKHVINRSNKVFIAYCAMTLLLNLVSNTLKICIFFSVYVFVCIFLSANAVH